MIIIAKSELFPNLSEVIFAEKDPDKITSEILSIYESLTGRTLARADPVRLFLDAVILSIIQQRNLIDFAAKQNLLAYASGSYLDHIGALLGVSRLEASHAVTTVRFTLGTQFSRSVVIPSGVRVSTGDGMTFATTAEAVIPAGSLSVSVSAQCVTAGISGNGYAPGQVNRLVDVLGFGTKAENITETSGGTDSESDENFRERIQIAPESFSAAGPKEAYRYFARSANADIIDVAVVTPPDTNPGEVHIYPLMTGGTLPSQEVLNAVLKVCSAEDIRPDTDYVSVKSPAAVNYVLDMTYWIDASNAGYAGYITSAVSSAVNDWIQWERQSLGRDINPSELTHRVLSAGAKRCEVRSPVFRVLKDYEVGMCVNSNIEYGGLEKA